MPVGPLKELNHDLVSVLSFSGRSPIEVNVLVDAWIIGNAVAEPRAFLESAHDEGPGSFEDPNDRPAPSSAASAAIPPFRDLGDHVIAVECGASVLPGDVDILPAVLDLGQDKSEAVPRDFERPDDQVHVLRQTQPPLLRLDDQALQLQVLHQAEERVHLALTDPERLCHLGRLLGAVLATSQVLEDFFRGDHQGAHLFRSSGMLTIGRQTCVCRCPGSCCRLRPKPTRQFRLLLLIVPFIVTSYPEAS